MQARLKGTKNIYTVKNLTLEEYEGTFFPNELEIQFSKDEIEERKYYKDLRNQAAVSFLSAIVTREGPDYYTAQRNVKNQVQEAVMYADELIKELRK